MRQGTIRAKTTGSVRATTMAQGMMPKLKTERLGLGQLKLQGDVAVAGTIDDGVVRRRLKKGWVRFGETDVR